MGITDSTTLHPGYDFYYSEPLVWRRSAADRGFLRRIARTIFDPSHEKGRNKGLLGIQIPLRHSRCFGMTSTVDWSEIVGRAPQSRDVVVGYANCCNDAFSSSKILLGILIHHVEIGCVAFSPTIQLEGVA